MKISSFSHFILISALGVSFFCPAPAIAAFPAFWNRPAENEPYLFTMTDELTPTLESGEETINFQPGLNLYPIAAKLTDLYGVHGSELCAPIAITHAFAFLKSYRRPAFVGLPSVPDMDGDGIPDTYQDRIRYFFNICKTDKNDGTHVREALACMRQFISYSTAYTPWAYMIGPHAIEAPAGSSLSDVQHVLTVADVHQYAQQGLAMLMTIGWYQFDPATQAYKRVGGHYFDVYGYDYSPEWGETKITLKVVNSFVDYTGRAPGQMYDDVLMTHIPAANGYAGVSAFEVNGPGLQFPGYKSLVEDIFVAIPVNR